MLIYHFLTLVASQPIANPFPQVVTSNGSVIQTALSILFGVIGAIALLMLVIGGFKYTISRGEPQEVAKAKDTILYALIGVIICILAEVIVNYVITNI